MGRFPGLFSDTLMRTGRQNTLIRTPKITIRVASSIVGRKPLPEPFTGLIATISNHVGNNLTCSAAYHGPQPALLLFTVHETPGLVQFQNITALGWLDGVTKRRQCLDKGFNPFRNRLACHPKNAFNPAQTASLSCRVQERFSGSLTVRRFGGQDEIGMTIFAMSLLTVDLIVSIFHQIVTTTTWT